MATITTSFASLLTGANFSPGGTVSVRNFINTFNDILIHVSGPELNITSDNLTSERTLTTGGDTAWRITNFGAAANVTLFRYGGGFSKDFSLPANSFTFVRGGAAGTYQLSGDTNNTIPKASSGLTPNGIRNFVTTDSYNIVGSNFNDTLTGGNAADTLFGGSGDDSLVGNAGNDSLDGGTGNDRLDGGGAVDSLNGGDGNDTLIGGAASDNLTGGDGADLFVFNNALEATDTITDFSIGQSDAIVVSDAGFGGGLTTVGGTLDSTLFGTTAGGTVRFVYNSGVLSFDTDSDPSSVALITIANLTNAPSLGASNILVIA